MRLNAAAQGLRERATLHRGVLAVAHVVGVFVVFAAATAIFFAEWLPHLPAALIGPPEDNMQDFWNTWYAAYAHDPGHFFFTNLIRFPQGTPLAYHSFAYPQVFAVALVSKVFGLSASSLILLQNLSLLISFPLAATGAYYLVRHFTGEHAGAALGGFVFAFNPSHIEQVMHHAHVSQIEFIPFFVLAFLLSIDRKSVAWLLAAVVLFALNALSCWYYLFYVAYFIVFHTAYVALRDRSLPRGWQLIAPIACLTGAAALLAPLLLPMVTAAVGGASVYAPGDDLYVANVVSYAAFPPFHLLGHLSAGIYSRLAATKDWNEWEGTVYLGLVNVAVLAWWWRAGDERQRRTLAYVLCGMAVFCIFASGDSLHVMRHRVAYMPDFLLSQLPFFKNVRTPSRAIVFVYLFLAIGVGSAAAWAWRAPRHIRRWGVAAVAILIVLDFYPARRLPMNPLLCSPGLALIHADSAKDFGVLDLPSGRPADGFADDLYMFQQTCHGRPIAQGNISRDVVVTLRDRLETHDLQAQRRQLTAAKVKYIVINRAPMGIPLHWFAADGSRDEYSSIYPVVYAGPDLTVLRVY